MSNAYDLTPFIDPDHGGVWCRVTLTPPRGAPLTVVGDHLHRDDVADTPHLMCGIYDIAEALGFPDPEDEHALEISALVDRQLALRPWAELVCAEGHLRIDLVVPR
ncbi:hypothetical protein [Mycolicibacterium lutetiense]|uniref:Uncharacterized protein n=1 Tax=Mycolicibacterium lutetiense TaxID=1641992 RepID=A0ABS4ZST8_9MYCO|nr:hypothetical protein [Mycolicibacterium lutetiense]MBP2452485.1 hypothetical protein [Mycolicibacterium lutetiense]